MKKSKKLNILYLCLVLLYLAIGIFVLVFANESREKNNLILGALILLSSIPHLLIFVLQGGLKNSRKYLYLFFSLIGICIGLITIFKTSISLDKVCVMWGCFDICRSSFEIADTLPEIKNHKWLEFIELLISIGEIIIAILLIIDEFEGIRLHLIYFGVVFIISAVKRILDNVIGSLSYEESSNSN
ncbi:MAG: hypothetical protein MJ222_00955 [Bacilli bacterium]|nr:hypothetical protein [Bacilli bacterium]